MDNQLNSGLILVALVFGLVVATFVAIVVGGMVILARRRKAHARLMQDGVRGTATVVDNRISSRHNSDGPDRLTFQPVVVLDHQDDARPVVLSNEEFQSFVVGTTLDVVYDPANPARIETVRAPGVAGYVLGGVMLVFVGGFAMAAAAIFGAGFAYFHGFGFPE